MTDDDGTRARTGLRIGWLVFALLVAALAISGWFILGERNHPVAGRPTVPPMLGGSGAVDRSTSPPAPTVRRPVPTAPGREVNVSGVGDVRTIVCTDNAVSINGARNTVTVTGHCTRVDVSGVENIVTVDAAEAISVSGIRNDVRFRSGAPELDKSGIDNTLERG